MATGIPTEYAGIRFRSRLEAQWAAFFDLLRWRWTYEPFDLKGYIPDFVITCTNVKGEHQTLVEVKPETSLVSLASHTPKIVASGWRGDALVVGAALLRRNEDEASLIGHGLFNEGPGATYGDGEPFGVEFFACWRCNGITVDPSGCGNCTLCGASEFDNTTTTWPHVDAGLLESLWATAKNRVQWRGEFGG